MARLGAVLARKTTQHKPGLAMEREARFYSYAFALYGYLLCVSALANCNNILAGGRNLAHVTDAVCSELRRFAARARHGMWPYSQKASKNYAPNIPKIIEKIHLNTSQNRCQNLPKSSPRRSKIEVWRGFRWKSLFDPKSSPLFSAPGGVLGRMSLPIQLESDF